MCVFFFIYMILFTLSIPGCSGGDVEKLLSNDFSDKKPQEISQRKIKTTLTPKDSVFLVDSYGIMNSQGMIAMDSEHFYISDFPALKLFIVDKQTLELADTLSIQEGRGPGEVQRISNYSVSQDYIVISDESLGKIQIWDKKKELVNEFLMENIFPFRVNLWNDGTLTVQSPRSADKGFIFYTLDQDGMLLNSFGDVSGEEYNPIRFSGQNIIDGEYYYFAGYSEHVLAKWDKDGDLQYSVTTIDAFPGEANLASFDGGGGQRTFQFVPHAFFSAIDISIYRDYWIVVHRGDWDEEPYQQFLDIYNKHTGQYKASIQLPQMAGQIEVDDQHIYALQRLDGEEMYLVIYENNLEKFLPISP